MKKDDILREKIKNALISTFKVISLKFNKDKLEDLGYTNVRLYPYQESGVPDFKNIDTPGKIRALHSAVVEATKPW